MLLFGAPARLTSASCDVQGQCQGTVFERAVSVCVEMFYCYIYKELIDKVPVGGAEEYTV